MTDEMMSLRPLIEKAPDADLLREMITFAAQRLMELEGAVKLAECERICRRHCSCRTVNQAARATPATSRQV
jgi:hypothetical protein